MAERRQVPSLPQNSLPYMLCYYCPSSSVPKNGLFFSRDQEICELVGLYLLHMMTSGKSPIFKHAQVGLYRDDCLAVIEGSARVVEKKIRELFKKENKLVKTWTENGIVKFKKDGSKKVLTARTTEELLHKLADSQ